MGYLDNSSITVDAILTKRGRELLSRNDGSFRITQFALGDDEIDYSLFNETHPNGTQYSAEAIENMPLIEAIPNGANMMNSKLITLTRGANAIPYIEVVNNSISINQNQQFSINPSTFNLTGTNTSQAEEYIFTVLDSRLMLPGEFTASGTGIATAADIGEFNTIETSLSVRGGSLTARATDSNALFSSTVTARTTSIIIEGVTSGAIVSVSITVNKTN
tara:strand:- start:84 stop:740 length:657 start_codon:yes stop_codon:yes gene_type:complete